METKKKRTSYAIIDTRSLTSSSPVDYVDPLHFVATIIIEVTANGGHRVGSLTMSMAFVLLNECQSYVYHRSTTVISTTQTF